MLTRFCRNCCKVDELDDELVLLVLDVPLALSMAETRFWKSFCRFDSALLELLELDDELLLLRLWIRFCRPVVRSLL